MFMDCKLTGKADKPRYWLLLKLSCWKGFKIINFCPQIHHILSGNSNSKSCNKQAEFCWRESFSSVFFA